MGFVWFWVNSIAACSVPLPLPVPQGIRAAHRLPSVAPAADRPRQAAHASAQPALWMAAGLTAAGFCTTSKRRHCGRRAPPHVVRRAVHGEARPAAATLQRIQEFCRKHGISTTGVLALTIHKNRTGQFTSVVVDLSKMEVLPSYPLEISNPKQEVRVGAARTPDGSKFIVNYADGLDRPATSACAGEASQRPSSEPFCCDCLRPYKPRRLDYGAEAMFQDFLSSKGTRSDVVYEVREQVNNGPTLSCRYFTLVSAKRTCIDFDASDKAKITAYKNFICAEHNRFFSVDIYRSRAGGRGSTLHHMRLIPFTSWREDLASEFLKDAGV
mmetsp:Transcript_144537/g.448812  ORF Transcript_144537/g.448812 Transcript_144537/m.448812 type:complete len:327 (+) Transcript_144537:34-1014(+)